MSPISFQIVRGDTTKLCVHCEDSAGNPLPLDGLALTFTLKRSTQDPDFAAIFQGTTAHGDIVILGMSVDGVCEVTIPSANTADTLLFRNYYWDIKSKTDLGSINTVAYGTIVPILSAAISV